MITSLNKKGMTPKKADNYLLKAIKRPDHEFKEAINYSKRRLR